jgi:hypothetical protein
VELTNRTAFIKGVWRILKSKGIYLLAYFSYKNGSAWNHFKKDQIHELFEEFFRINWIKHVSSLEGDNVVRYFYEVFLEKLVNKSKTR